MKGTKLGIFNEQREWLRQCRKSRGPSSITNSVLELRNHIKRSRNSLQVTEEALFSENSRVSVTAVEKRPPDAKVQVRRFPGG